MFLRLTGTRYFPNASSPKGQSGEFFSTELFFPHKIYSRPCKYELPCHIVQKGLKVLKYIDVVFQNSANFEGIPAFDVFCQQKRTDL